MFDDVYNAKDLFIHFKKNFVIINLNKHTCLHKKFNKCIKIKDDFYTLIFCEQFFVSLWLYILVALLCRISNLYAFYMDS